MIPQTIPVFLSSMTIPNKVSPTLSFEEFYDGIRAHDSKNPNCNFCISSTMTQYSNILEDLLSKFDTLSEVNDVETLMQQFLNNIHEMSNNLALTYKDISLIFAKFELLRDIGESLSNRALVLYVNSLFKLIQLFDACESKNQSKTLKPASLVGLIKKGPQIIEKPSSMRYVSPRVVQQKFNRTSTVLPPIDGSQKIEKPLYVYLWGLHYLYGKSVYHIASRNTDIEPRQKIECFSQLVSIIRSTLYIINIDCLFGSFLEFIQISYIVNECPIISESQFLLKMSFDIGDTSPVFRLLLEKSLRLIKHLSQKPDLIASFDASEISNMIYFVFSKYANDSSMSQLSIELLEIFCLDEIVRGSIIAKFTPENVAQDFLNMLNTVDSSLPVFSHLCSLLSLFAEKEFDIMNVLSSRDIITAFTNRIMCILNSSNQKSLKYLISVVTTLSKNKDTSLSYENSLHDIINDPSIVIIEENLPYWVNLISFFIFHNPKSLTELIIQHIGEWLYIENEIVIIEALKLLDVSLVYSNEKIATTQIPKSVFSLIEHDNPEISYLSISTTSLLISNPILCQIFIEDGYIETIDHVSEMLPIDSPIQKDIIAINTMCSKVSR